MKTIRLFLFFITVSLVGYSQSTVRLDQLNLTNATTGWGTIVSNKSIGSNSLKIGGTNYTNGVGIHSPSEIVLSLDGASSRFQAIVGIDDEVSPDNANLEFQVYADNVLVWTSGIMQSTDLIRTKTIDLDISGKKYLSLVSTIGNNGTNWFDHADWVNAVFTYTGTVPICISKSTIPAPPVINYKTYFIEKGRSAAFKLEVLSKSPATYSFTNIPEGMSFDPQRNLMVGTIPNTGIYNFKLKVTNTEGADSADLVLDVIESKRNKTPLMGWASWNNYRVNISESIIKMQTDALVSSGLASAGYNHVNIDDGFFNQRNPDGTVRLDATKFPNGMKVVADYIHSKGLKAGFYSEAGSNTCGSIYDAQTGGNGAGMYQHDQQDADLFIKNWGFDYLKVDYCGGLVQKLDERTRYADIRLALDKAGNPNIEMNVCRWQFPGTWVTSFADSWRISQDITNTWASMTSILDLNTYLAAYSSQGHYNDMDMLEVGRGMTAEEDKSHFSLWCILSSPLALGNDLTTLSAQTKTILTNTEVIAVNQDTTGLQARLIKDNGAGLQVWAKNLNGKQSLERAVVLFNRSTSAATMSVSWQDLNLTGSASVRDLWLHTDKGSFASNYSVTVPSHGVVMLKIVGTQATLQEVFEAEYGWINNFNLTQHAVVVPNQGRPTKDASCSGRAKANWLGNNEDNWIEFRDVFADKADEYTLSITYNTSENRNATVSVNGTITELTNLNSAGTFKTVTLPVALRKGQNTIRISNATGWLPDLDKISLDLNRNSTSISSPLSDAIIKVYPNPANDKITINGVSLQENNNITIYSAIGSIMYREPVSESVKTISVEQFPNGLYLMQVNENGKEIHKEKLLICKK